MHRAIGRLRSYGADMRAAAVRRCFTRLTNAFSKKLENHARMVALYALWYNFVRVHKTLRMSPAMAAGIEPRLWSIEDVVRLVEWRGDSESGVLLVLRRRHKIHLAPRTNARIKNPVTPAKAGAHGRTGSRPSPGRQEGEHRTESNECI
jgi:hypothetical protein